MDRKLRRWELALMLGAALALVLGAWLGGEQRSLAGRVVRLHVIANSDSARDQALKLAERDELAAAGQAVVDAQGGTDRVTAQLTRCWFPTKTYDGFALPAGEYEALRVVIGDGRGQNWWCVAYPPLCLGAASETIEDAAQAGQFTSGQAKLVTGDSGPYVLKFKGMELLGRLEGLFS